MEMGFGFECEEEEEKVILVKTDSKFKKFLSLRSLFKKEDSAIEALQNRANMFINTNNYEAYVKMLVQGYQPTKNQVDTFHQIVNELLCSRSSKEANTIRLENLLGEGLKLNDDNVLHLIVDSKYNSLFYKNTEFFKSFSNLSYENHSLPNLTQQIKDITQTPYFSDILYTFFESRINYKKAVYKDTVETFKYILEHNPSLILKNVSFDKFVKLNEKLQSQELYFHQYSILNNIVNNFYSNDINIILNSTKSNYSGNILSSLTMEKIKSGHHQMHDLPEEALSIIKNIEDIYTKIQDKKNPNQDVEQLNIMLEKRIPEILSKYLTIDVSYRTSLKNTDGQNAQELMLEGLNNIYTTFDNVYKDINQEGIHSLSATTRYTKSFR